MSLIRSAPCVVPVALGIGYSGDGVLSVSLSIVAALALLLVIRSIGLRAATTAASEPWSERHR